MAWGIRAVEAFLGALTTKFTKHHKGLTKLKNTGKYFMILVHFFLYNVATRCYLFLCKGSQTMKKRSLLWIIPLAILLLLVIVVQLGMWGSHGGFFKFLAGQRDPGPELDPAISQSDLPGGSTYSISVQVDASQALAHLPPEYLSFAIDTSQVVGGKWWDPKASGAEIGSGTVNAPPFDFNQPQLDLLTQALAPATLRLGGSEADKVFYDLSEKGDAAIPEDYESVLRRQQWDDANAFAQRNGLKLIFTLNAGPGNRDESGAWDPANARELIAYSAAQGYPVSGWELGNELNIFWFVHGLGEQVSPAQYHQDLAAARALVKDYYPEATFSGQGSAFWPLLGEPLGLFYSMMPGYLQHSGDLTDFVSWHYYPQQSRRGPIASRRAYPGRLLDPANLDEAAYWADQVASLRDRYAPGKPIWLGETGNAQFGGEPGLSDVYLAGLWWLDQLGLLALHDQQVVVRQSLTGMNYGMIDDVTLSPRPDYWNSLLWKRLMGSEVYSAQVQGENTEKLRVYAHSTPGTDGAVTLLLINLDPQRSAHVNLPGLDGEAIMYALTTPDLFSQTVLLNGEELALTPQGNLPDISGQPFDPGGVLSVHPLSYTFLVLK
jgi:heparanase 1